MNLLMLTKFFPFGTGEAFVENEINILAEYYEKVLIIACEVSPDETFVRDVPNNVKTIRISSANKVGDVASGLKYYFSKGAALKNELNDGLKFLQKAFLFYFESKSQQIYNSIISETIFKEFITESYVLYSYWLFRTARVGDLICDNAEPVYMFSRAHRYDLYADENSLHYLPYRNRFLSKYDAVFVCSENGTEYLKQQYPRYKSKIYTSLLGTIDHGVGTPSNDSIFRIVSCSRISEVKRVNRILEALALLKDRCTRIEWVHIGEGEGLEKLKREASTFREPIRISLLGNKSNQEVMEFYHTQPVDLFINVSTSEGLPVSIMEAISFGIPVVATNVGGTSEIVKNDVTGRLISKEFELAELAKIIESFVSMKNSDRAQYDGIRTNCRKYWEENFQAINNYHKLCRYLETQRCD